MYCRMMIFAKVLRLALLLSPLVLTRGSGETLAVPQPGSFPNLPQPGPLPLSLQTSAPEQAPGAGLAPAENPSQFPALVPAPWGTGSAAEPIQGPGPAMAPRSPYDPVFNPIISKSPTNVPTQNSYSNMQTVQANSNGQVTTYNSNTAAGSYNNYGSGPTTDGSNYGQQSQQQGGQQQQQNNGGYGGYSSQSGYTNGQQGNSNVQQGNSQNQLPITNAAAPSPAQLASVNPMVKAVDLAQQQTQSTPQFSFGSDGATIQQPVVTNPADGVTSGGNQFKVNEYGVILGNVGTGGSVQMSNNGGVTIDPGTAGNLWNLAKQAASLYGRKMML